MIKTLLLWFFLLISIFTFSAYGSTATPEIKGLRTSKQQKEPKAMCDMMMESSKQRSQRINVRLHDVQHIKKISKKARTVYGGGNNVKSPHKTYGSTATPEIKGLRTLKQQKEPKSMYGMMLESSKGLHDVEHIKKMSKKARTVYGGGNNVKSPHKSKSSANTNSIKSSSLFIAAILLVACFF